MGLGGAITKSIGMKTHGLSQFGAIALLFCAQISSALAVTFTHDAFISFADQTHDGQDIVVTNCTLTVDGSHAFNSLQVLNGGVLTHSPFTYGPQQFTVSVFEEPQTLSSTNPATLNNTNVDASTITVMNASASIFYAEGIDYVVTVSNQFTQLTLTTNSAIAEGSTVYVDYDWAQSFQGFDLVINNNATVATGGAINVSGKGYAGGIGFDSGSGASRSTNFPYTFTAGGGAAHGGNGGLSSTSARGGASYDSTTNPAALGSGGGSGSSVGGAGGGVATLSVGGTFEMNGQFLADGLNGTNTHSGGGAGGSILVYAQNFSGAGAMSAGGGAGDLPDGGGAGGGRIAVYFASNNFTGSIAAFGGGGFMAGGAGTIYLRSGTDTNAAGQLFIVNGGKRGTNTFISPDAISDLTIAGGAIAQSPPALTVSNLFLGSNSWLTCTDSTPLALTITGDATLESNALINADLKTSSGPGAGAGLNPACSSAGGGGYGGYGGASACGLRGGTAYGSITQPSLMGSPGGGSPVVLAKGGGAIHMVVGGALSLDGNISANGGSAQTAANGGGSGGSVWLLVGTLAGEGTISANGGSASSLAGGGGGGRVAVYFNASSFSGNIQAHGGAGAHAGGAGTIYTKNNTFPLSGQVIVDNAGLTGGATALTSMFGQFDLQIKGGAMLTNTGGIVYLGNLFIASNSWFLAPGYPLIPQIQVTASNATIQASGGILVDGESGGSIGAGQTYLSTGGGGGGGGYGGGSASNAPGGISIGTIVSPSVSGGIGGYGQGSGGYGGGVINLTVLKTLQLDGILSANGVSGGGINSGGGAGGSIQLTVGTLSGAGAISANGGAGNNIGGGGAGGRIAISYVTNLFSGATTAYGGPGGRYGGAGTIYVTGSPGFPSPLPQLIIANSGVPGATTPLSSSQGLIDLTVTGAAMVSNNLSSINLGSLLVGSNSVLLAYPFGQQTITVFSNVAVLAGGAVSADGMGPSDGIGSGGNLNSTGGGGGNAGYGGASGAGAAGGLWVSDSLTAPQQRGSRGGNGFNQGSGGNGGGSLRLNVTGSLRVDGRISADGITATNLNSGGGSGGSVVLSAKVISGNGVISASGGAGNNVGGGGGGGRIAILYNTNLYTGIVAAHGGIGSNAGGAGTIYTTSNMNGQGLFSQLILDNAGAQGGYTPLSTGIPFNINLTITGGAILTNSPSSTVTLANLFIGSNSTWLVYSLSSQILTIQSNATIQAGGKITADGESFSGPNPGLSLSFTGGGGGHGGYGGASLSNAPGGGITSDAIIQPTLTGSRGGQGSLNSAGGYGGGSLQVSARGTLQLDGKISTDGLPSSGLNGGGGSGGSIFLQVGKLVGAGNISANGGAGNNVGGGGAGGRIAIWYNTNLFSGAVTARGGAGGNAGGAGTIYTTSSFGGAGRTTKLIVDNGGTRGTNTPIGNTLSPATDFVIGSGASVALGSSSTWNSLVVSSNATLIATNSVGALGLTISSNLTVQSGGAITLDGQGWAANLGVGHGASPVDNLPGGGAGHGGVGSSGSQATSAGGISYDSITTPALPGSGGGSTTNIGSSGGGATSFSVHGVLAVDGTISANGKPGIATGAGGGSGGCLWLTAGTLSGAGKISVDGGDGEPFGGGGGGAGGRIAVWYNTNRFTGTYSAHGGAGPFLAGGAGTIYLKTNSLNTAGLILDNSGAPGTNTPLDTLPMGVALSTRNGAEANSSLPINLQSLSIGAASGINAESLIPLNLTVAGDAFIDTNGAITADNAGFNAGSGPGVGEVDFFGDGSGGGYGGMGGASFFGAPGGSAYGSSNQPISFGSAGGMTPEIPGFSQGGGSVHFTVNGALTLNGKVSANGADGYIAGSGGGSGGSVWITAQKLMGNGAITANGGAGESGEGGGGGGGRIALYAGSNSFAGTILAGGGASLTPGQDGTIYIPTSFLISGNVTDTNGTGVAGLTLQPSGLTAAMSDSNGLYSLTVPVLWSGSIVPMGSGIIIPSSRTYSNLSSDVPGQNYQVTSPAAFTLASGQSDGTNMNLSWYAINGVTYRVLCSSNLVDWVPYGPSVLGNNAPATVAWPVTNAPQLFFRLSASY